MKSIAATGFLCWSWSISPAFNTLDLTNQLNNTSIIEVGVTEPNKYFIVQDRENAC